MLTTKKTIVFLFASIYNNFSLVFVCVLIIMPSFDCPLPPFFAILLFSLTPHHSLLHSPPSFSLPTTLSLSLSHTHTLSHSHFLHFQFFTTADSTENLFVFTNDKLLFFHVSLFSWIIFSVFTDPGLGPVGGGFSSWKKIKYWQWK